MKIWIFLSLPKQISNSAAIMIIIWREYTHAHNKCKKLSNTDMILLDPRYKHTHFHFIALY